ncbi:dienelactone hydrolase family protein [Moniliophthora roreri]|nr:dienelactone hydrolase family protein [Moniliophthora roreri]
MLTRLRTVLHHLNKYRAMSSSAGAVHNTNAACCSIPPIQSDYKPKGTYTSHGKFNKVYVTGPASSDNAIVCVYDIFGFFPQTQQGADIIASSLKTKVYMPDFFEPDGPFPIDKFPPQTDEEKQQLQDFFAGTANPADNIAKLVTFGKTLKEEGAKRVGAYGFCWGGKVTISSGGESTPFDAVSIVHPAMLSAEDVSKLSVSLAIYISKDEPINEYNKIVEILAKKPFAAQCDHKNYTNMFHGWAAARADLSNPENKKEFEDIYKRLVDYFKKTLA